MTELATLLCGEDGPLTSALAARIGPAGKARIWVPGQQVPSDVGAAIDCHVVDRTAKAAALTQLDEELPPSCPILTCCHADSVTRLAAGARGADRITGFALLPPLQGRTAVECARGIRTQEVAVEATEEVWRRAGLAPVWIRDSAGMVMPRIVACLANEAAFAVMERAASSADIDRAMALGTAYPRGPLAWASLIGLDHVVAILDGLSAEHGDDRYRVAPLLRKMALAGSTDWETAA